jgi:protein-glutamine gamma-glutamyltransferase
VQVNALQFLIAAALLFWGWQTRMFTFALPMAAVVVASAFTRKRLVFAPRDFARLWDLTLVLVMGAAIYNRQTLSISSAVIAFLQWLPILVFPFMAAFLFSNCARVPHSTFIFWWRSKTVKADRTINPLYPYFATCLLAASAGSVRDPWFYPVALLLIGAALLLHRWHRLRAAPTILLFLLVAGAGHLLHTRWRDFQSELETKTIHWFASFFPKQFEDQEIHTSLGEIGRLKSSGRVVMRVRGTPGHNPPVLYRQVAFDQYRRGIWLSTRRQYSTVAERPVGTWQLASLPNCTNSVLISAAVPGGRILLPLPLGCGRVRGFVATRVEQNRFGNVRVWDAPDPVACSADFASDASHEPPPQKHDLQIHPDDEPALAAIVGELGLNSIAPGHVIKKLDQFFTANFRYTPLLSPPDLNPAKSNMTSFVAAFLHETRAGHCEYFATAGALLLRHAGIPARYAVGYAGVEPTGNAGEFRIRERHAHSWVLAWIDGRWHDFDPTPQAWPQSEAQRSSLLRPLADWWADLRFRIAVWQPLPGFDSRIAILVLCPMGGFFVWALLRRRGRLRVHKQRVTSLARSYAWPGLDSEFFLVEATLTKEGAARQAEETLAAWLSRLGTRRSSILLLAPALKLHYKYRFDPDGLSDDERSALAKSVRLWLAEQEHP